MKVLVVYDSVYGNTEKIARAIAGTFTTGNEVKVVRAADANSDDVKNIDLLIVGAPTQGGRATQAIQAFLSKIPADVLKNTGVAAFDTRMKVMIAKILGYAAGRIAPLLTRKGGRLIVPAEGFIVKGKEGPIEAGELERATAWGREILEKRKAPGIGH